MSQLAFSLAFSETAPSGDEGAIFHVPEPDLPCPEWHLPEKWAAKSHKERLRLIEQHERVNRLEPAKVSSGPGPSRFTTDAGVRWGKEKGWKVMDRERFDARTKRHHDCMLGMDVIFDTMGSEGMAGVQAAGLSERAAHWQRFEQRGGIEKARRLSITIYYLEFVRGEKEPRKVEKWT